MSVKPICALAISATLLTGCFGSRQTNGTIGGAFVGTGAGTALSSWAANHIEDETTRHVVIAVGGIVGGVAGGFLGNKLFKEGKKSPLEKLTESNVNSKNTSFVSNKEYNIDDHSRKSEDFTLDTGHIGLEFCSQPHGGDGFMAPPAYGTH